MGLKKAIKKVAKKDVVVADKAFQQRGFNKTEGFKGAN